MLKYILYIEENISPNWRNKMQVIWRKKLAVFLRFSIVIDLFEHKKTFIYGLFFALLEKMQFDMTLQMVL